MDIKGETYTTKEGPDPLSDFLSPDSEGRIAPSSDSYPSPSLSPMLKSAFPPPAIIPLVESLEPRRRRRRKNPELENPVLRATKKAVRTIKNRTFARQSRERKKAELERLKGEIGVLKAELAECKRKLARYEVIEKRISTLGEEPSLVLSAPLQQAAETADQKNFQLSLTKKVEETIEQGQKALERLAHMMVEIAVPMPLRFCMWRAEKLVNMYDTGTESPQEESLLGIARGVIVKNMAIYKCRKTITAATNTVRGHVKRLLEAQRGIQTETAKLWDQLKRDIIPRYDTAKAKRHLSLWPGIKNKPEIAEYALYHICDADFRPDPVCSTEDDVSQCSNGMNIDKQAN